jgi:hypothetical protein
MQRRQFISLLCGIATGLTWPLSSSAQKPNIRRIGVLVVGNTGADAVSFQAELREELRRSGYVEGQNLAFERGLWSTDEIEAVNDPLSRPEVRPFFVAPVRCDLAADRLTRRVR